MVRLRRWFYGKMVSFGSPQDRECLQAAEERRLLRSWLTHGEIIQLMLALAINLPKKMLTHQNADFLGLSVEFTTLS
jgi:hypothetical protein